MVDSSTLALGLRGRVPRRWRGSGRPPVALGASRGGSSGPSMAVRTSPSEIAVGGPRQAIAPRRAPGAGDQPRPLELEQDLDQVALGDAVRSEISRIRSGGVVRALLRQREHGQTRVLGLRGDLHRAADPSRPCSRRATSQLAAVERVQAAFRLGLPGPAPGPLVLAGADRLGARPAADRGIALSWSGLYGTWLATMNAQTSRCVQFSSGLTFTRPNFGSQPTTFALARCADWSARIAVIQAS